ncbi:CpsD/CapB family tyrosine-protein kinase [Neotabrizicola sp. VNH66]|uniref:CpsD/CapB family tyrosine-protein kinase n=1 Tax=Neotabrizicola sp. VNH66 TaxID=3400918 RepID=UPI003C0E04A1
MPDQENRDDPPTAQAARTGHVPLFRPGQPVVASPITLDQRTGREIFHTPVSFAPMNPAKVWESLTEISPDRDRMAGNGLFTGGEQTPVVQTFDMLRTRVLQAMAKHGWSRLAVTSPGPGCGKSFVAANLALALARLPSCRTVLLDMDLRNPGLAPLFGQTETAPLLEFLTGEQPLESHFRRLGRNLALGLNGAPVTLAAETLQDPECIAALSALREMLEPDLMIFDTTPALARDDMMALAPQVDAVLLVTDGTETTPAEVTECERMFEGRVPLLGVILNRAQDRGLKKGRFGRGWFGGRR